ncbi:hypothetical protein IFM89_039649 [Coptis chinensis]|uniref:Uncharacterized protein n=1 Tax=Coptis chinensis TaxID=261450 RepID=A0A835GVX5_9MAGN|nr:hypothetical protein IFM89_039649 [Coptis chinensis]
MANLAISSILEKMTGKDKDYRYMATSDLLNELSKEGFKADIDLEGKISNIVLQQLDDASGDVSGLAVKCVLHRHPTIDKKRRKGIEVYRALELIHFIENASGTLGEKGY